MNAAFMNIMKVILNCGEILLMTEIKQTRQERIEDINRKILTLPKTNINQFILFEILYKLGAVFVFFPVLSYTERLLLMVNGEHVIAWNNIGKIALNPLTWIVILAIIFLMTVFAEIEKFGLIRMLQEAIDYKKLKATDGMREGFELTLASIKPENWMLVLYCLVILPCTQTMDSASVTKFLYMPGFILEFFEKYAVLQYVYYALLAALAYLGFRLSFLMIAMVTENLNFMDAWKMSWNLTKGKKQLTLFKDWLLMSIKLLLIFLTVSLAVIAMSFLVIIWIEPGYTFEKLATTENIFTLLAILTLIYAWINIAVSQSLFVSRYYLLRLKDGTEIPPCENASSSITGKWVYGAFLVTCLIILYFSVPKRFHQFKGVMQGNADSVLIMAHRGYSAAAPENTMPAFEAAYDSGATAVELDVQMTKDGEIIVLHDSSLGRTAGLNKDVWDVTYDEIRYLDNGSFFDEKFAGTPIPTLEQVLQYADGKLFLNIEIKRTGHDDGIEDKVVELIRQYDFNAQCDVTSQDYETLVYIHKKYPDILTAYTTTVGIGDVPRLDACDIVSIQETFADYDLVESMHRQGKRVFVWTVNESETMERLIGLNVDAILTNDPVLGAEIISRHSGPLDKLQRIQQVMTYFY